MSTKTTKVAIVPKKFSGKIEEDAFKYLKNFNIAATSNNWNDDYKAVQLPNYLEGTANLWYINWIRERTSTQAAAARIAGTVPIPPPTPVKWDELTDALQLAFRTLASKDVAEERLLARRQKIGETAEDYIYSMLDLLHDYDENMDEATKVRYIIKGLQDQYLEKINPLSLTTVDQVLKVIRKIKETQFLIDHREEMNLTRQSQEFANLTSSFEKLKTEILEGLQNVKPSFSAVPANYSQQNNQQQQNMEKRCYTCNRPGHFSKDCRQKLTCYACGGKGHSSKNCRLKEKLFCQNCQKPGHIKTVCRSGNDQERRQESPKAPFNQSQFPHQQKVPLNNPIPTLPPLNK